LLDVGCNDTDVVKSYDHKIPPFTASILTDQKTNNLTLT